MLVSSGAYNSPQLLQLSGVGPGDLLKTHGIEVVLDAEGVGNDLQDHLQVRLITRCAQKVTLNDIVNHPVRRAMAGVRYALSRSGPLTIAAGTSGVLQDQPAAGLARHSNSLHSALDRQDGREAASVLRLHRLGVPVAAREPRLAENPDADPAAPPEIRINFSQPKPTVLPSSTASISCARYWPRPR